MPLLQEYIREWIERRRARKITYQQAVIRVGRGAAYLDEVLPGWHRNIDTERLCIGKGTDCVLGQLFGTFLQGLSKSLIQEESPLRQAPVQLGFLCIGGVCEALQEQDYEYLNQAWQEELSRRFDRERNNMTMWLNELGIEGIKCSIHETTE